MRLWVVFANCGISFKGPYLYEDRDKAKAMFKKLSALLDHEKYENWSAIMVREQVPSAKI